METDSSSSRRSSGRLREERQRRLMKEKITIQDSLRLIIYPILAIPVELTSEIFLYCLPAVDAQPSTKLAPLLLGQICRMWRDIAYTNPRLWAALKISSWGRDGFQRLMQDWLRRVGSLPLSFDLTLPYTHCPFFKPAGYFRYCPCPSSSLFTDHFGHLSSFCGHNFTLSDCIALLVLSPRLIYCEFSSISGSFLRDPTTRVLLPDAEELALTVRGISDTNCALLLLDSLTVPNLRSLSLACAFPRTTDNRFLSFLQRATRIQTFSVHSFDTPVESITTILDAMPTLTSFELRAYASNTAFDILRLLHESAIFLPRLQKLFLCVWQKLSSEDRFPPILLEALSSRWEAKYEITQLVDFRFLFPTDTLVDSKLLDGVSTLREQGMRIEVSGM
ncbi:hypothetical protein K438DRAFT_1748230 [Mycena galopus ATCC 62051]|nr:hypothetical protein K438DRAFT_1748230 [Mycena galopus ATCC 62051]